MSVQQRGVTLNSAELLIDSFSGNRRENMRHSFAVCHFQNDTAKKYTEGRIKILLLKE